MADYGRMKTFRTGTLSFPLSDSHIVHTQWDKRLKVTLGVQYKQQRPCYHSFRAIILRPELPPTHQYDMVNGNEQPAGSARVFHFYWPVDIH